jgi:hypothetical protein
VAGAQLRLIWDFIRTLPAWWAGSTERHVSSDAARAHGTSSPAGGRGWRAGRGAR